MRTHGVLAKWNDDRGFGFIAPAQGGDELFVHVSAFPRDGVRPRLNELVSFEIEAGPNGKPRAVRIMRPGGQVAPVRPRHPRGADRSARPATTLGTVFGFLAILAIGTIGYSRMKETFAENQHVPAASASPLAAASSMRTEDFRCDGRTLCSQMTSCAEATYFIQHCPGTRMDGNGDGEPCEQQWCN